MMRRLLDRLAGWPAADRLLLALAGVLLVGAALRAVKGPGTAHGPELASGPVMTADAAPQAPAHILPEAIVAAIHTDPFRADRSAPPERYRLAATAERSPDENERRWRSLVPDYRLRGTAVSAGDRLALIEGSPSRRGLWVYAMGDSIDLFLLAVVAGDSAVLMGSDTTLTLKIVKAWKP